MLSAVNPLALRKHVWGIQLTLLLDEVLRDITGGQWPGEARTQQGEENRPIKKETKEKEPLLLLFNIVFHF